MKAKRTKHSSSFKARVAIEALQERESLSELARKYEIHPTMITRWKKEFLEKAPGVFDQPDPSKKGDPDLEKLYAKIGQLEMEKEFLKKNLKKLGL
jgi:transposase-like protein